MSKREAGPRRRAGPRAYGLPTLLFAAAISACLPTRSAKADSGYELGHGYTVGPFNFAGYGEITLAAPDEGRKTVSLEDFSLFVTGHVNRWLNPFVEGELTHLDFTHSGPSGSDHGDGSFVLERLYNDFELTDSLTFRLGKMLTPVGSWNVIHGAPLVLTTVRPAVTYRNFSEYLTGASLIYTDPDGDNPGLEVYWQPDREFSERPNSITFDQYKMVEGLHLTIPLSLLDQIGFSYQRSQDSRNINQSLFGLDFKYTIDKLTLQGEATYSFLGDGASGHQPRAEAAAYLAGSYALDDIWSVYSWYEGFSSRDYAAVSHDLLAGVAFHPVPAMSIKVEYLQNIGGPPVNPTGLFASWSILF
ncbi:MAG: hypothetical protein JWO51_373 [Rhodospirillales bacterium]|nr:hypothetical protein [Rhodospirillales bacterium]